MPTGARLLLAVFALCCGAARADDAPAEDWKKLTTKGELSVFRDASQKVTRYKVEGKVPANLFDLLAVVADIEARTKWVDSLTEARILEGDVEDTVTIYELYDLPWPAMDRDSVVQSVITQDLQHLEVNVAYAEVAHEAAPVKKEAVRMPTVRGAMHFQYVDRHTSFVQVIIGVDMGGAIPKFIVDGFARQAPVKTVEGLLKQVARTRGTYADFVDRHVAEARLVCEVPFELDDGTP